MSNVSRGCCLSNRCGGWCRTLLCHSVRIALDKGSILIDTDYAGTMPAFYKTIKGLGIRVSDITYVLATHYHPDHIGLVSELMRDRSNPDDIITLSEA